MCALIQAGGIQSKMGWLANTICGPRATDYNNSSFLIIIRVEDEDNDRYEQRNVWSKSEQKSWGKDLCWNIIKFKTTSKSIWILPLETIWDKIPNGFPLNQSLPKPSLCYQTKCITAVLKVSKFEILQLLMRWCCWCADALMLLMQMMRWCCWFCWFCWSLMLLMYWCEFFLK